LQSKDALSFSRLEQGVIRHLDLAYRPDFSSQTMAGTARYQVGSPAAGDLYLDIAGLEIHSIHSGDRSLTWMVDAHDPVLGQRLTIQGLNGAQNFEIEFTTPRGATALQWLEARQTHDGQAPFLFSQCQAIHARSIFPCQDTPAVRFTYTAELHAPEGLTALMAAAPKAVERVDGGTIYRYEMRQPIPAYLFAFAIGRLEAREISGRTRVYAEPGVIDEAAWEFADTEEMLGQAESLFGPYLWERYDILVLPHSFPWGGMENPRLTFLSPTTITGDRSQTSTIAHELAHSWTGNLVTNATWEDFWLNEGWTTYAEQRILEALRGQDYAEMLAAYGRQKMLINVEQAGIEPQFTRLKTELTGADLHQGTSMVAYQKGYAFLRRLEEEVGRARFDRFVRRYIDKYQFRSIDTAEFLAFLRAELPGIEEQVDLDTWVYGEGLPPDAPRFKSKMLAEVQGVLAAYRQGVKPTQDEVSGWDINQVSLFLQEIPLEISAEDCAYFERLFGLDRTANYFLLSEYYRRAILAGRREALPKVEDYLQSVGRILLVLPVWRALAGADWSRPLARELLERYRPRLHPQTVLPVERVLSRAGV